MELNPFFVTGILCALFFSCSAQSLSLITHSFCVVLVRFVKADDSWKWWFYIDKTHKCGCMYWKRKVLAHLFKKKQTGSRNKYTCVPIQEETYWYTYWNRKILGYLFQRWWPQYSGLTVRLWHCHAFCFLTFWHFPSSSCRHHAFYISALWQHLTKHDISSVSTQTSTQVWNLQE